MGVLESLESIHADLMTKGWSTVSSQSIGLSHEMFLHGVTPMISGYRDALIFITLKDGDV